MARVGATVSSLNSVSLQSSQCLVMQWQILTSVPNLQAPFPLFTPMQYLNLICIQGTSAVPVQNGLTAWPPVLLLVAFSRTIVPQQLTEGP